MRKQTRACLITAYKQLDLTRENIKRIRCQYKHLWDMPIVVVSTAEEPMGFKELEKYGGVYVVEYVGAPFNPGSPFSVKSNLKFRFKIEPRILCSMDIGLELAWEIGANKVLHFHSDTSWEPSKEHILERTFAELSGYYLIADLSKLMLDNTWEPAIRKILWHPEGLFFNLDLVRQIGFHKLSTYFTNRNYQSRLPKGVEYMLGDFFHMCVCGEPCGDFNTSFDLDKYVKINQVRYPHGTFENGLVNLSGDQPGHSDQVLDYRPAHNGDTPYHD